MQNPSNDLEKRLVEFECKLSKTEKLLSESENQKEKLEKFSSMVAHDLKGPLREIKMFAELVESSLPVPTEDQKEFLETIKAKALRTQRLVDDLLDFAKQAKTEGEKQTVDLNQLVDQALQDLRRPIYEKKMRVLVGRLPSIRAYPGQMRQLFTNLISNSLKYSCGENPQIEIGGSYSQSWIEIFVRDNGIGFEPEYAEKIFLPFERLTSVSEGSGMGLAICQTIVRAHEGEIRAVGIPGQGATFFIHLPITLMEVKFKKAKKVQNSEVQRKCG